ncbi:MAG: FtsK/SpoIIIE domain-containing protein [Rhodocyclaceae bacterium]|nr:FtsK/SpoIIIE domain-containing protein [Rhodocyclaceae bacterium]
MSDISIGALDEQTIERVIEQGLGVRAKRDARKWVALRLALAASLRLPTPPDESLDHIEDRKGGNSYHLEQVTGKGLRHEDGEPRQDYDDTACALLSIFHQMNLFDDYAAYRRFLQRHIRRGLREFRTGWRDSHDFHEFLFQELFSGESRHAVDDGLVDRLSGALEEIGITAETRRVVEGPRLTRFFLYLPSADDLAPITRGLGKLGHILGLGAQNAFLTHTDEPKVIALDIPRRQDTWSTVMGYQLADWADKYEGDFLLPVWPGVDVIGNPFVLDLAVAPHLLVGGTTGSGKSVCLNALIVSLLRGPSRERLQLCLIDPKRVEFEPYRRLEGLFGGEVITEAQEARAVLLQLVVEMETRTQLLAQVGARDLAEAHQHGVMLDVLRIVVVVEELADLLMQDEDAEMPLVRLAGKARASGIHLVLATQRPDAATFSGLLRSNIPSRIALTVQKASESKIILDETGADHLTGQGDMLIKTAQGTTRVHGVKVSTDDIASAISRYQRNG